MKTRENLRQGNINHHERFCSKRANISARYNNWNLWLFLDRTSLFDDVSKICNEPLNINLSNHDFEDGLKNEIIIYDE